MRFIDNLMKSFSGVSHTDPVGTTSIPVGEDLMKSQRIQDARAIVEDPLAILNSLGFKDKPFSLSYVTLKQMATRNSVVASIIATRVNQVSSFTKPARFTKDGVGFEITMREPKKQPSESQKALMLAIESFIENCGFDYNPSRDSFDTFVRKVIRDSLVYDQLTFEIVPDRRGLPAEFYAVDASTIRAASIDVEDSRDYITSTTNSNPNNTQWVQVYNGEVIEEFSGMELCFAVRNPRTDINIQPYGFSELEVLIHQVTSHLWAEEYNSRYFSQGGTTKGILNLKGTNISKEQLDNFRRQWTAQVAGLTGAWKTPVVSVDGLEYINVSQSNREMEYEMWMNYLINICCAVYQIDPAEINFPNRGGSGGSSGGGLGDGGIEDRLKNSKDKGLRPLLRFIEDTVNRYIVKRFTDDFSFHFVGIDPETEADKLATTEKEVRTFRTINEVRKMKDLDPIENGDIILDQTYTMYLLQMQQQQQMEQGGEVPPGEEPTQPSGDDSEEQTVDWKEPSQESSEEDAISQSIDENYDN